MVTTLHSLNEMAARAIAGALNHLRSDPIHDLLTETDRDRLEQFVAEYFDDPACCTDDDLSGKCIHHHCNNKHLAVFIAFADSDTEVGQGKE